MANSVSDEFFEGTEKLLEVWFTSSDQQNSDGDLRRLPRCFLDEIVEKVHAKILSSVRNESVDAYLLSESSMFVSKNRFILKTCGTTTLFYALQPLLTKVKDECGFDKVEDIFYSRKKYLQPDLQMDPHRSFEDEVSHLDKLFDSGAAYALGRLNRDCWYLYTIDNPPAAGICQPDQTLELLMSDMDPEVMNIFYMCNSATARDATEKCGINNIFPQALIDDYLFSPCGYSMNGIMPEGRYFTIHVTPEAEFSYVSFESNVQQADYPALIAKVLNCFKPGKFLLTIFANKGSVVSGIHRDLEQMERFEGYNRQDHQVCVFKNYNLTYSHYARPPF